MLSLTSSSNLNNGPQRESLFCDSAYAMMLDMMLDVGLARTALAARVALQMARYRPKELWNAHLTDLFLHFACHYLGSLRELRIRRN
jgi:hypothetical protein